MGHGCSVCNDAAAVQGNVQVFAACIRGRILTLFQWIFSASHLGVCYATFRNAGWSSLVAREAHNLEVAGSNPAPATKLLYPRKMSRCRMADMVQYSETHHIQSDFSISMVRSLNPHVS